MGRWARKPVNHTSWVAVVTPTDRPKSVRNCCLMELFCDVVCVVSLPFWHFCWCKKILKLFKHLNLYYMHSPTYKHGSYTKLLQIKLFTAKKSLEMALKYTKMTKSKKTSKRVKNLTSEWNQKWQHFFHNASRSLLCIWFVAVAFQSEEEVLWRMTLVTLFGPALDPPLDGSWRKTTLVRDLEYFIHTKFHQNPSSGSGKDNAWSQ